MARFVKPVIGIYKFPPLDSLGLSAFEGGCVECSAYVLLSTSIAVSDFICAVGGSRTTIVSRRMDERTQLGNVPRKVVAW